MGVCVKKFAVLFLAAFLFTACGSDNNGTAADPRSGTPGGGSKWTAQEMQSRTEGCVSRGGAPYDAETWRKFCSCVYEAAAREWTYQEFSTNTTDKLNQLQSKYQTVTKCADSAGIRYQ